MLLILNNVPSQYPELYEIIADLDSSFKGLINKDKVQMLMQHSNKICDTLVDKAVLQDEETTANALWVVQKFLDFVKSYSLFWSHLWTGQYKDAWMKLQDASDNLRMVRKFTADQTFLCVNRFDQQLKQLEKLFPYDVFMSTEMIIQHQTCSICGNNPLDPQCDHMPGQLYGGKYCYLVAGDMEVRNVALISDPIDKRQVIDVLDEGQTEEQKYHILTEFTRDRTNPYLMFSYQEAEEETPLSEYGDIGRNDPCPCNSGKKLKNCCLDKGFIMTPCIDIEITEYFGMQLKEAMDALMANKTRA